MDKKTVHSADPRQPLPQKRALKRTETRLILWAWFGFLIVVLVIVGMLSNRKGPGNNQTARQRVPPRIQQAVGMTAPTLEAAYNQNADVMNKITVSIYDGNAGRGAPVLLGSGVIVSRQTVLTNLHVAANRTCLFARASSPQQAAYPVVVYRTDPSNDLALLQVTNNTDFPSVAVFGNSDTVDVGDIVSTMGNAFGNGNLLTSGIIIDKNFSYAVNGRAYNNIFRTNINTYPGTSGGPLVNIRGEVIGVTTSADYPQNNYMGIGYATAINRASALLDTLRQGQGPGNVIAPAVYLPNFDTIGNPYSLAA